MGVSLAITWRIVLLFFVTNGIFRIAVPFFSVFTVSFYLMYFKDLGKTFWYFISCLDLALHLFLDGPK
jgi:hypothetical protein|tara:strand:- start:1452 stop:1655 length:204 start_codon:yes stop_codon:yes gene_type:complete